MTELHVMPYDVDALRRKGAILIDIRSQNDWQDEHITGALSVPLDMLDVSSLRRYISNEKDLIILYCQTGAKTSTHCAQLLDAVTPAKAVILEGGINTWKLLGYETIQNKMKPISKLRQVKITVGGLVIAGTLAGMLITAEFYLLPLSFGVYYLFEGITGHCSFSLLAKKMNRNLK
ncbi:rhodanese-like domain-containing protein [Rahnella inusitata]|uniref:rhodanese-like domain-containing protein n=1 Tax=Rahnella inusitata TaxID=58169 RepID=UPI001BC85345|nr:rhodanese-like domain-containing protein [Rahnella inusitata]QUT18105.1 hypothetical protein I2123_24590 [Rahnella inusitata]